MCHTLGSVGRTLDADLRDQFEQEHSDGRGHAAKIHRTLRVTPAMAAKVTDRLFDVSDIVALLESAESKKAA